jgi:hypothetical protein
VSAAAFAARLAQSSRDVHDPTYTFKTLYFNNTLDHFDFMPVSVRLLAYGGRAVAWRTSAIAQPHCRVDCCPCRPVVVGVVQHAPGNMSTYSQKYLVNDTYVAFARRC